MRRLVLTGAAGCLLAAAFPEIDFAPFAWVALAPLIAAAVTAPSVGRAAIEGYAFGLTAHIVSFSWWYRLLVHYGRLSHPEAAGVFLLLAFYIGAYAALFAAGVRATAARRGAAWALMMAPALWAGLELLRGRLLTGLPWGLLGATQYRTPVMIQIADIGGVTSVSFAVAAANAAAAWLYLSWRSRRLGHPPPGDYRAPAVLLAVPLAAALYGGARLAQEFPAAGSVRVGLIQGNVPQEEKWEPAARKRILNEHLEATRAAAAQGAKLIVWPESSVPLPLTSRPAYREILETLARDLRVDLLVGSVHEEAAGTPEERVRNSAFLIPGTPASVEQRYDKIHLVPFGEYVPLRGWLGPVDKLVMEASDFSGGERVVVISTGEGRLGPLFCFEAIFPELVRRFTRGGAQVLVNLTNDGFLGDTAGPPQHLALASIRAVESRRYLLRAANTGISAVVDEKGRLLQTAAYGTAAVLIADVPLRDLRTIYMRLGDAFGWACVILAAASLIAPGISRRGTSWTRIFYDVKPR